MNTEKQELYSRIITLRAEGNTLKQVAATLNEEGFSKRDGAPIEAINVSGYLSTIKKRSNGSTGISRAEALNSRNATIQAQIDALKAQQTAGVNDLPRLVFESPQYIEFNMTQDGGVHCSVGDSFELDFEQTKKLTNWIKENF